MRHASPICALLRTGGHRAARAADAGPAGRGCRAASQGQRHRAVCVWPDYYGVTHRNANTHKLEGIDIDLSHELARDLQVRCSMWIPPSSR
jgi:hypothetical protein